MNYIFKISLAFSNYADSTLVFFTNVVLTYTAASVFFPTPIPTLASLQILYDAFINASAAAATGGTILTEQKKQAKVALIEGLRQLTLYIQQNGNNDPVRLLSSGFFITGGPRTNWPIPATPVILSVLDGIYSGGFVVKISKVDFALMYELRYTTDPFGPEARWNVVPPITSTTFKVNGLTEGTKIWIQVRTSNSKGQSEWSDPFYFMVR